jgi:ornithine cyclodeaminase/alanine dehydrogenase-like protein (mu-crystallin family)
MKIRVLSASDVQIALPMSKAIEAMKRAFGQLSAGQAVMPLRTRLHTDKGVTLCMPAYLPQNQALGIKIVSVYEGNSSLGLPVITAIVLIFDPQTGFPMALMDGVALTAIRTGATGGLAADLLSRHNATAVGIFGAGVQARAQLKGVMAVRNVQKVRILSRSSKSAKQLAAEIAGWPDAPAVTLALTPRQVIEGADIIITATTSTTPLFNGNDLQPGSHVTAIGSHTPLAHEVDILTVQSATVVVDSREACLAEAGEIIIPKARIHAELGEMVLNPADNRMEKSPCSNQLGWRFKMPRPQPLFWRKQRKKAWGFL